MNPQAQTDIGIAIIIIGTILLCFAARYVNAGIVRAKKAKETQNAQMFASMLASMIAKELAKSSKPDDSF